MQYDVKVIEYFVCDWFVMFGFDCIVELMYFVVMSEDINFVFYVFIVKCVVEEVWFLVFDIVIVKLCEFVVEYVDVVMFFCMYGQFVMFIIMGKEFVVFVWCFECVCVQIVGFEYFVKFFGVMGIWFVYFVVDFDVDWLIIVCEYIEGLGFGFNIFIIQIELYDWQVEFYDCVCYVGGILYNFVIDIWMYILFGYFVQILVVGVIGLLMMLYKINLICFENVEVNFEILSVLFVFFGQIFVISCLQCDFIDFIMQCNIGVVFGYLLFVLDNLCCGLNVILLLCDVLFVDFDVNWEVFVEVIQMVICVEVVVGCFLIIDLYVFFKEFICGYWVGVVDFVVFVQGFEIGDVVKQCLLLLIFVMYIGIVECFVC